MSDLCEQWSLNKLAHQLYTSTRSLQRVFQKEGTTFSKYLVQIRVEKAREMIEAKKMGLTEIAFCTGFSDQAHFTRSFKSLYEIPPSGFQGLIN